MKREILVRNQGTRMRSKTILNTFTVSVALCLYVVFAVAVASMLVLLVPQPDSRISAGDTDNRGFLPNSQGPLFPYQSGLHVYPKPPPVYKIMIVEGQVVQKSTGEPIPNADVLALRQSGKKLQKSMGQADSRGCFKLELPAEKSSESAEEDYAVYTYFDDPKTAGVDYVPGVRNVPVKADAHYYLTFELFDGASVLIDKEAVYTDLWQISSRTLSIRDPSTDLELKVGDYVFSYYQRNWQASTKTYGNESLHYQVPIITLKQVVVPANTEFRVAVNVEFQERYLQAGVYSYDSLNHNFTVDAPGHLKLEKGGVFHLDMRAYSLPWSLRRSEDLASTVGASMSQRETEGFYLSMEKQRFAQATSHLIVAQTHLDLRDYDGSLGMIRSANSELRDIIGWLGSMRQEAIYSVFILIPFLGFASVGLSSLLFEATARKTVASIGMYCALVALLYLLYPGSVFMTSSQLVAYSALSFTALLVLFVAFPEALKRKTGREIVSLWSVVTSVFSMAKRNMKTRKLRFGLTTLSVIVLASSFISLTSFSTRFGLTQQKVSGLTSSVPSVLVRGPAEPPSAKQGSSTSIPGDQPYDVYWFPPLDESTMKWFQARPEVLSVAPKYETLPFNFFGEVFGVPISGIVGIIPSLESKTLHLNEIVIEGRYLEDQDEDAALISSELSESINTGPDGVFELKTIGEDIRLQVAGVFDSQRLEDIQDLDGNLFVPWKLELVTVESDTGVTLIMNKLTPCLGRETIIVTSNKAAQIRQVYFSRFDVTLRPQPALQTYARDIALEMGLRTWACSENGVFLAQLTYYYEGKFLELLVPWAIVVLNVVVTMLNSFHERRREIFIYSAIGMSPSHITILFLAEAVLIGVLGGGIGYMAGLGTYRIMSFLQLVIEVKQKVSAWWVLGAVATSLAAVLVGGGIATRGSLIITPSLRRQWGGEKRTLPGLGATSLDLPLKVTEEEVDEFTAYVTRRLYYHIDPRFFQYASVHISREDTEKERIITLPFTYRPQGPLTMVYSKNRIILKREMSEKLYRIEILSEGDPKGVRTAGSIVRKILMEWSVARGKLNRQDQPTGL